MQPLKQFLDVYFYNYLVSLYFESLKTFQKKFVMSQVGIIHKYVMTEE